MSWLGSATSWGGEVWSSLVAGSVHKRSTASSCLNHEWFVTTSTWWGAKCVRKLFCVGNARARAPAL